MMKPNILWHLANFTTFQKLYTDAYGFQPTTCKLGIGDSNGSQCTESNTQDTRWSTTVHKMGRGWRAIAYVAALILELDIALMLFMGRTLFRCIVIVAIFLSTASVVSATLFVTFKENMKRDSEKERWIKATEHPRETCSVDFWTTLSLPLTFLAGSALLSVAGFVILLAYDPPVQPPRKSVEVGICSGIITVFALLVFAGLYRVVKLVK